MRIGVGSSDVCSSDLARIDALTLSPQLGALADGLIDTTIINRGAINGDVVFANGGVYVNDGGTVTGDVTVTNPNAVQGDADFGASFKTEAFINRSQTGSTDVTGVIEPGNGLDYLLQSFSASESYALPATLPPHFEVGGVDTLGTDASIT